MTGKKWSNEAELAELMLARARAGRNVVLSPDTALFVGVKLQTVAKKPTADAVARLLCNLKCATICYRCRGMSNAVVREYGLSVPPRAQTISDPRSQTE